MDGCRSCELVQRRDEGKAALWDSILRGQYWDLVHCYGTSVEGWLVLVARRHIPAIADMSEEEALELGRLLREASRALAQAVGCEKTYVVQFAEHPQHPHVHFHVIPRMADQPEHMRSVRIFEQLGVPPEAEVSEKRMDEIGRRVRKAMAPE